MDNFFRYKGYIGSVNFDKEDKIFHGSVIGITDVVGFEGEDVVSLEKDFHYAVDDYIETCLGIGKEPEKSFISFFSLPHTQPKQNIRSGYHLPQNQKEQISIL